ncbi:hypothetical protein [Sinomicrobium sp. M5D2P17]
MDSKLKTFLTSSFMCLIFMSCDFINLKQKDGMENDILKNIHIKGIIINRDGKTEIKTTDEILIKDVETSLSRIDSTDLIKGKRLHGAKNLFDVILKTKEDDIWLLFKEHKEEGITVDIFRRSGQDNFNYSLGRLYNATSYYELFKQVEGRKRER